jgi:hypothetical protein
MHLSTCGAQYSTGHHTHPTPRTKNLRSDAAFSVPRQRKIRAGTPNQRGFRCAGTDAADVSGLGSVVSPGLCTFRMDARKFPSMNLLADDHGGFADS